MSENVTAVEPWIVEQQWDLTYQHSADAITGTFYRTLRDEARLIGVRCDGCRRVLMPPRSFCDRCFRPTDDVVPVGDEGVIELFTILYRPVRGLPEPPNVVAYVRLDGADTAIANLLGGVDLADRERALRAVAIGNRARVVYHDDRQGRMTDFEFAIAA